ncbi:MAG TPA: hypothetical protein DCZ13_10565 [Porticoccaceae bacterium]|nr:hypothetical protein [Porticoccaceae bacterium]
MCVAFATATYLPTASGAIFDELSKQELSKIRGKFLSRSNGVKYFGISMDTRWGRPSQSTHTVGMGLGVNLADKNAPSIKISRGGSLGSKVANTPGPKINPALTQISGSAQNIQVAGNGNTIENKVELAIVGPESIASAGIVHHTKPMAAPTTPIQAGVPANETETFDSDGVVTQFSSAPNSVGYSVETGDGTVVQQLGANPLGNNSLLQSVSLAGHGQHIVNNVKMAVVLDTNRQLRNTALNVGSHAALLGLR